MFAARPAEREGLDASSATRKLLRMGLERYIAQLYAGGDLTLREASAILQLPLREAVEELGRLGVPGNVTAAENLKAFEESRGLEV